MKTILVSNILLFTIAAMPAGAELSGKKLIQYGPEFPDTKFFREHIRDMEKVGFDGVVIRAARKDAPRDDTSNWSMGYRVFSREKLDPKDADGPISDLKDVRSKVLTENFIQVCPTIPADVEWFDPAWSEIVPHNAAVMARIAKLGGCRGLMIDTEEYGSFPLWSYDRYDASLKAKHTFSEYRARVRECGREFIRAINREYPDITLLFLLGPSFGYERVQAYGREKARYSLLMDFIDGICEAASPGTIVVDGFEQSYGYRRASFFWRARRLILKDCLRVSAVPEEYMEHIRAGFGISMDNGPWHPDDFSKNYFTPDEFRNSLAYAMDASDKYVWVWTGTGLEWWTGKNIPDEYIRALRLSKQGPVIPRKEREYIGAIPKAAEMKGYSDDETFASFHVSLIELMDLPRDGWRFRRDPEGRGIRAGWYGLGCDDSRWRTISIGEFWENCGEHYDGDAWYRRSFNAPPLPRDRSVYLVFGAVDETARVWLNGRYVGGHDIGQAGWDKPFAIDVTGAIKSAESNLLAVYVGDTGRVGGIWKSVKLMAGR